MFGRGCQNPRRQSRIKLRRNDRAAMMPELRRVFAKGDRGDYERQWIYNETDHDITIERNETDMVIRIKEVTIKPPFRSGRRKA